MWLVAPKMLWQVSHINTCVKFTFCIWNVWCKQFNANWKQSTTWENAVNDVRHGSMRSRNVTVTFLKQNVNFTGMLRYVGYMGYILATTFVIKRKSYINTYYTWFHIDTDYKRTVEDQWLSVFRCRLRQCKHHSCLSGRPPPFISSLTYILRLQDVYSSWCAI